MYSKNNRAFEKIIKICFISFLTFSLLSTPLSSISVKNTEFEDLDTTIINQKNVSSKKNGLDQKFIYNLTYALSQIVFTEYDHENEIPKGRFFGSKGERKAAELLAENMTKIGLYVTKEKLEPIKSLSEYPLTRLLEVKDYKISVNGKEIECFIAPSWEHPQAKEQDLTKEIEENQLQIKRLPSHPLIYNPKLAQETEDFVFITQDQWNDPNVKLPRIDWLKPFLHPLKFYMLFHVTSLYKIRDETRFFAKHYPNCKGYILYDFNDHCYDMIFFDSPYKNYLPTLFINGSLGKKIWENPDDYTMDLYLDQFYNESVESYNVIGQINGTDTSKTIIISSLYDCWWNQGTADSAIGMGIVLAVAKYFKEYNIQPKYTLKFIAFSGEECDLRGAKYYEAVHKDEDVICIIDLNQVGFTQEFPPLTFDIVSNKIQFLNDLYSIAIESNYYERTGNETKVSKVYMNSIPSNPVPFSVNRPRCKCVSFFKDGGWILHHRNGHNYTKGDVMKYYNFTDVQVTSELVLNITKFVALDESFFEQNNECKFMNSFDVIRYLTSLMKIGPRNAK